MNYSLEEIYQLTGKSDKVSLIEFKQGSETHKNYGAYLVMQVFYSQEEREHLDKTIKEGVTGSVGYVKGEYLGTDLSPDKVSLLKTKGIPTQDISTVLWTTNTNHNNTFHATEKKALSKIVIETNQLSDEKEQRFIYGYYNKLVSEGNELNPYERKIYLGNKMLFAPENITASEKVEIANDYQASQDIKFEFLKAKYQMKTIQDDENIEYSKFIKVKMIKSFAILKECFQTVSISIQDVLKNNSDFASQLFLNILSFKDKRLSVIGKKAIYLDLEGYTHIFLKHVEEMKVNDRFKNKDNFLWNKEDVIPVMKKIINELNNEIQKHFEATPTKSFFKNQGHDLYFQGDYYAFHIEPTGRVSNFHRLKKEHGKKN